MQSRPSPDEPGPIPAARASLACALLAAHVLLAEVALTRLLSVTLYYHYAFAVVALGLAGLGWGARGWRPPEGEGVRRASLLDACSAAATSLLLSAILLLAVPWRPFLRAAGEVPLETAGFVARWVQSVARWLAPLELLLLILLVAIPFAFAGRALAALFAASGGRAARMRASEALGVALGGAISAFVIGGLGAPTALVAAALVASLAGVGLALPASGESGSASRRRAIWLGAGAALLGVLAATGTLVPFPPLWGLTRLRFAFRQASGPLFLGALALAAEIPGAVARPRRSVRALVQAGGLCVLLVLQAVSPILRVQYVKAGHLESRPLREGWTLDARAALQPGNLFTDGPAKLNFAWGPSRINKGPIVDQMQIQVDALSASPMVRFRGNLEEIDHLRYDITSLPLHALAPGSEVLVVGVGGGRDLLAALLFEARRVTGLEVNPHLVRWLCQDYAAFTGRLCASDKVRIERAEARAWLARSSERFDFIQLAFADSWAAGPAGAYALNENFLYTREALRSYLEHLTPAGIVSFSHYRPQPEAPTIERLFLTALEALEETGAQGPESHLFLAATPDPVSSVATLVVGRQPLTAEQIQKLSQAAAEQGFLILYPGGGRAGEAYASLLPAEGRAQRLASRPSDIRPTDDDRPFFFLTSRWRGPRRAGAGSGTLDFHDNAVALLVPVGLVGGVAALAGTFGRRRRRAGVAGAGVGGPGWRQGAFFLLSGFAFVAAEVGMMQRLALVLGGPGSALTVVLVVLMAAAAVGASLAQAAPAERVPAWLRSSAGGSALTLAGVAALLPLLTAQGLGLPLAVRLTASVGLLAATGLGLGILGGSALRLVEAAGESALASAWSASALGAAAAGTAGWTIAVGLGYSAVLVAGAVACAATLLVVPGSYTKG
jgi:hypothetical protein